MINVNRYLYEIAELINMDYGKVSIYGKSNVIRAIADTLCVSFPAIEERGYQIACDYANTLATGDVPVPILSHNLDVQPAAMLWGILSHTIDFDDSCPQLCGHPSVVLFSTIAPLAAHYKKKGKEVVEAYICGYEALNRFSLGVSNIQYNIGWHTTTTIGIFGAIEGACKLLNLTVNQTVNALGIGASLACGLQANFGTMTKTLHPGVIASNAICAAELARRGFSSSPDVFSAESSYFTAYGGELIQVDKERLFINEGIIMKVYPSCGCTTRANDIALSLRRKYGVSPENVKKITLRISALTNNCLKYVDPLNGTEAKFSLEYCFTKCFLDGGIGIKDFEDNYVLKRKSEESFVRVASKIQREIPVDLIKGVSFAEEYLEAVVELNDGGVITVRSITPKGFPQNPVSDDEFNAKFNDCVNAFLTKAEADALLLRIMNIEDESNFADILFNVVKLMNKKAKLSNIKRR